jgi:ABC-type Fe3+-hydroxamate transport system substrate-binding protein
VWQRAHFVLFDPMEDQLSAEFILKSNPDYIFAKALTGHA